MWNNSNVCFVIMGTVPLLEKKTIYGISPKLNEMSFVRHQWRVIAWHDLEAATNGAAED